MTGERKIGQGAAVKGAGKGKGAGDVGKKNKRGKKKLALGGRPLSPDPAKRLPEIVTVGLKRVEKTGGPRSRGRARSGVEKVEGRKGTCL